MWQFRARMLVPSLTNCVAVGKLSNIYQSQFLHLKIKNNDISS